MRLMQHVQDRSSFKTVIAVLPTPFREDGALDGDVLGRLVRSVCDGGVTVLTVNGNTGEFSSLSPDEQAEASDVVIAAAGGRATVITGVGGDLRSAIRAATRAADSGASAVMVHEPSGPFRSAAGWLEYQVQIADAVRDVAVVPYVRDPTVDSAALGRLFERSPNVTAVKYAVPDPIRFRALVSDLGTDRVAWICGLAELWAPLFWVAQAEGFTSGLAAVAPSIAIRMLEQLRASDHAGAWATWDTIRPLEELRARQQGAANVPAIKEALHQLGLGARTVRPPIAELDAADRRAVTEILASWQMVPMPAGAA
jgi:4-hydroxy-tetrahydrodipicolinate synthase